VEAGGTVLKDSLGRPKTVLHTFSKPIMIDGTMETRTWNYRIEYSFSTGRDVPEGIPTDMDIFVIRDAAEPFFMERIRIQRLVLSTTPLASEQLAFEPIVKDASISVRVIKNNTEYIAENGLLRERPKADDPKFQMRSQTAKPLFFGVILTLLLAPALWVLLRLKQE
jgi:hypothetical protein